ncbi:unnamed protein product [Adineta ricciae]|uniref:Uncharacterized protein n=1 Tax=Adineta ricciae TaxID=249248 RepID=A0A816HTR8_ADIRI|nr:unnamed protein product [Adineta ricciae]CAF1690636.1 unnamed protein product [Adineta ricciae]
MSIINLQLALDALESGNLQFGIETLQTIAKTGTNAAALYNLGIRYERGIGVEQDRAKVNNLIENHDDKQDHYDSINHDIQLAEIKINELEHLRLTVHKLPIDGHLIVRRHLFPLPHPCR